MKKTTIAVATSVVLGVAMAPIAAADNGPSSGSSNRPTAEVAAPKGLASTNLGPDKKPLGAQSFASAYGGFPAYRQLRVITQKSRYRIDSSPAAGRMALSVWRPNTLPSQWRIGQRMKISSSGTPIKNIAPTLNYYQKKNHYIWSSAQTWQQYRYYALTGITRYKSTPILITRFERTPWYRGRSIYGNMPLTAYSYQNRASGTRISVYDARVGKSYRKVPGGTLWRASTAGYVIW
ncbi:hypothetical protein [Janibacter sp. GXQ6167]|uniref:hypothetical protein n=1 Tax=Janibacter sp. GXQ6167 TaxID=3240791 RepID=UPI003524BCB9